MNQNGADSEAVSLWRKKAQMDAFEAGIPQARVVRPANARLFVFQSNEEDAVRERNDFIAGLE
jgi:hypothetical protein